MMKTERSIRVGGADTYVGKERKCGERDGEGSTMGGDVSQRTRLLLLTSLLDRLVMRCTNTQIVVMNGHGISISTLASCYSMLNGYALFPE